MATLVKDSRGRSRFWIACVTTADGRRLKKSTKETDKKKAKVIADAWQEAEDRARGGNLTEIQTRRIIQEILERVTGRKADDPTVREWLDRWLQTESGAVAPATITRYRQVGRDFLRSLGPRAEVRLEALTTEVLSRFVMSCWLKGSRPIAST